MFTFQANTQCRAPCYEVVGSVKKNEQPFFIQKWQQNNTVYYTRILSDYWEMFGYVLYKEISKLTICEGYRVFFKVAIHYTTIHEMTHYNVKHAYIYAHYLYYVYTKI